MSRSFSVRLSVDARARLAEHARSGGVTPHALAVRHIEEGLRMAEHPGVCFGDSEHGRVAKVGPWPLWRVIACLLHNRDDAHEVAAELDLGDRHVWVAIDYYGQFTDEIDEHLATYLRERTAQTQPAAAGLEALKRARTGGR